MERVRPPQSGHTPTFEGSLSTRKGSPSVGRLSELSPASLSYTSPSRTRHSRFSKRRTYLRHRS
jgi:hypothetical protein